MKQASCTLLGKAIQSYLYVTNNLIIVDQFNILFTKDYVIHNPFLQKARQKISIFISSCRPTFWEGHPNYR